MTEYIKCETCLYNKNCQFLAEHRNTIVEDCSAYKNAADVVEVVHGEWVRDIGSYGRIKCSRCEWTKPYIEDYYEAEHLANMSYCPNCGAKMDGDK